VILPDFLSIRNPMNQPYLSADDLPSDQMTQLSPILLRQLEEATKKSFFRKCDRLLRILLSSCHWYFKVDSGILTLVMICHDIESYQNVMKAITQLADKLKYFANRARIRVSSTVNQVMPCVVNIDANLSEEP